MNEKQPYFNPSALRDSPKKSKNSKKIKKGKRSKSFQKNPIRIFIWLTLFAFILSGLLAIRNASFAVKQGKMYQERITHLEKELKKLNKKQEIQVPETEAFLSGFLREYFTISKDRIENQKRLDQLQGYSKELNFRVSFLPVESQHVVLLENYGYQEMGDTYLATYGLTTRSDKGKTSQSLVKVRFKKQKGKYHVLSLPYQLAYTPENWYSSSSDNKKALPSQSIDDRSVQENVKNFVTQFLKEYQANNTDNLRYLMADVQGLPEGWSVEAKELKILGEKESPVVEMNLILQQKDTQITYNERVQLYLTTTEDGKYFIEKITYE
ncbi:hypothetical protein EH331_11605 [Enterococcus faecalis]|nr:hypothetical protein [Enterococcus faecalis]